MIDKNDNLRCDGCGKKLGANLQGQVEIVCPRCKRYNKYVIIGSNQYQSYKVVALENNT